MKECYVVIRQPEVDDYWKIESVYTDELLCDEIVSNLNTKYDLHIEQAKKCEECHIYNEETETEEFKLMNDCMKAEIKEDRNGLYCENECSYYGHPDCFYKVKTNLINE